MKSSAVSFGIIGDTSELGAELGQAKDRIAVSSFVAIATLLWFGSTTGLAKFFAAYPAMMVYIPGFIIIAILIYLHIRRTKRIVPWRRYFAMTLDYASLAVMIAVGGEIMILMFAVMIRVTMGYGLRYGPRFLMIATAMAFACLGSTALLTTYWRDQPFVMMSFVLMTIIVPNYAMALLMRIDQAREAAQAASLQKSRFLAQASHDLRQPVHAIGLFLASLRQTRLSSAQAAVVDRIDRAQQGVARLFRSLLDISTLDSGAVTPRLEPVPVRQIFHELEQQNATMATWTHTEVKFVNSSVTVLADAALLTTMVQNLITNALKYAPGRKVLVGCRRRGAALSLVVADTGDGIEQQHLPRLKEDFYQVRKLGAPDIQGVGLGLGIVDRLAGLMGLSLEIRSRVGHGTLAAIHGLPLASAPVGPSSPPLSSAARPLAGLRVLLIEDDIDVREATSELLESWGCMVDAHVAYPVDPLACDLIIADFDIGGGVTGAEAIAAVRKAADSHVPAIIMTGHDKERIRTFIDPDIPIVTKPVQPPELRSLINTAKLTRTAAAL